MAVSISARFIKRFATAHYALAVLAVAAAVGLRLALDPLLGAHVPYLPFVAAVLVVGRFGGRGPALACTALGCLGVWYLFLEPRFSFAPPEPTAAVGLALFAVIGIAISFLETPGGLPSGTVAAYRLKPTYLDPVGAPLVRRIAMTAGAALALGVLASLLWSGLTRSMDADRLVGHTYQVLNAAASVRSSLETALTAERGYLLTGEDQYIEAYQSAVASGQQARAALRRLTADNRVQQARLDEFDRLWQVRLDMLANAIDVRRKEGRAAVADLIRTGRGGKLMDQLRATLDAVDDEERRLLHIHTMAANQADSRTRWILGLGSGSLVLLLIMAGATIERHIHERKVAERVLARQARLIDLSRDAIITADGNRVVTGWNSGAQEMYGWTEKEATGRIMYELLHSSSSIPTAEMDDVLVREGRWEGVLTQTRSDGRQIVVECRQVLQRDDAGLPAGYLEINRDITDRKEAEEALRLSEEKFAKAFATNPAAVSITRLKDGLTIDVNETWQAVMGYSRDEAIGRSTLDLPTWPTPEHRSRFVNELKAKGRLQGWEQTLLRKSGEAFTSLFSAMILTMAGEEVVIASWLDISDRKHAEDALRDSEAQFRTLANAIPQLCWMANADGWIFWYNQRWYQYTGMTPEQMEGWGWQSVHDPEALPEVLARWKASLATGEPFDMVFPLRGADRVLRPFLTRIMPVHDLHGKVVRWFGTNTDISEQRETEEALRESEKRFRSTMDSMMEGCQIIGRNWRCVYVNDAAARQVRKPREEILGKRYTDMWPGIESTDAFAVFTRSMEDHQPRAMESEFTFPDGSTGWFDLKLEPVPEGLFILSVDITERKQAEEALRQSEASFRNLFESMDEGCASCEMIYDAAGQPIDFKCLAVNPAFSRLIGLAAEQVMGRSIRTVMPDVESSWIEAAGRVVQTGKGERFSSPVAATGKHFEALAWSLAWRSGRHRFAVAFTDVTDRKRAEEEIRQLNAELAQRVRERTTELETTNSELEAFAYSVSHDLRAPLRGIDGWTLALIEDYCGQCQMLDAKGRGYLDRVRSETQRMGRLIDDLLQLSRITRAEMHRERVDLSVAAESIAARLRETHPQRSLEFAIRPGLTGFGDARLLEIALTNLLENAVKFTGPRAHARIEFETGECNGKMAFVVRDNGVGFDMAYAGTLFGAFQRLHSESEFPGTGIGLATVQRVIRRHGGRIWAQAEPGRGASFYFTIGGE